LDPLGLMYFINLRQKTCNGCDRGNNPENIHSIHTSSPLLLVLNNDALGSQVFPKEGVQRFKMTLTDPHVRMVGGPSKAMAPSGRRRKPNFLAPFMHLEEVRNFFILHGKGKRELLDIHINVCRL